MALALAALPQDARSGATDSLAAKRFDQVVDSLPAMATPSSARHADEDVMITTLDDQAARCTVSPENGRMMDGGFQPNDNFRASLDISNGTDRPAYLKIISQDNANIATIYVGEKRSARIDHVPNGDYTIKVAHGGYLMADCQTIRDATGVLRFVGRIRFQTVITVTEQEDGVLTDYKIVRQHVTLNTVKNGNARMSKTTIADFNAD